MSTAAAARHSRESPSANPQSDSEGASHSRSRSGHSRRRHRHSRKHRHKRSKHSHRHRSRGSDESDESVGSGGGADRSRGTHRSGSSHRSRHHSSGRHRDSRSHRHHHRRHKHRHGHRHTSRSREGERASSGSSHDDDAPIGRRHRHTRQPSADADTEASARLELAKRVASKLGLNDASPKASARSAGGSQRTLTRPGSARAPPSSSPTLSARKATAAALFGVPQQPTPDGTDGEGGATTGGETDMDDFDPDNDDYFTWGGQDEVEQAQAYAQVLARQEAEARAAKAAAEKLKQQESRRKSGDMSMAQAAQHLVVARRLKAALDVVREQQGKDLDVNDPHLQPTARTRFEQPTHDTLVSSEAATQAREAASRSLRLYKPKSAIKAMMLSSFRSRRRASITSDDAGSEHGGDGGDGGLVGAAMRVAGSAAAASAQLHAAMARAERRNAAAELRRMGPGAQPQDDFRPRRKYRGKRILGPDPEDLAAEQAVRAKVGAAATFAAARVPSLLKMRLPKLRRNSKGKLVEDTRSEAEQAATTATADANTTAEPQKRRVMFQLVGGEVVAPGDSDGEGGGDDGDKGSKRRGSTDGDKAKRRRDLQRGGRGAGGARYARKELIKHKRQMERLKRQKENQKWWKRVLIRVGLAKEDPFILDDLSDDDEDDAVQAARELAGEQAAAAAEQEEGGGAGAGDGEGSEDDGSDADAVEEESEDEEKAPEEMTEEEKQAEILRKRMLRDPNFIDVLGVGKTRNAEVDIFENYRSKPIPTVIRGVMGYMKKRYLLKAADKRAVKMDETARALCDGFLMNAKQRRSIRRAFMDIHFDQLGMSYLTGSQIKRFIAKPHNTMGCIPYWALLMHIGEKPSPFLYLLFDQVLAPLLVTDGLIRQATAPGRKKQLQNKAQLDARFIKYIRRQVKIPNGLLSFDDFVRVTVVLATYKKLEMLRLLFNLFDKDGSNDISVAEFLLLAATVNASGAVFPGNVRKAMSDLDADGSGTLTFDEFCVLDDSYPTVLYPAFRIQSKLKKLLLTPQEWDAMAVQREVVTEYQINNPGMPLPKKTAKLLDAAGPKSALDKLISKFAWLKGFKARTEGNVSGGKRKVLPVAELIKQRKYGIKFEVTDQDRVDRALAHQPVFNTGRVGLAPEVPELKFQRQPVEAATPRSSRSDGGASVAGFGTTPQPMTDPDLFFAQQAGLVTDSMLEDNDEDSKSVHSATSSRVGADENDDTMSIGGVRGSKGAGGGAAGTAAGGAAANTSDDNGAGVRMRRTWVNADLERTAETQGADGESRRATAGTGGGNTPRNDNLPLTEAQKSARELYARTAAVVAHEAVVMEHTRALRAAHEARAAARAANAAAGAGGGRGSDSDAAGSQGRQRRGSQPRPVNARRRASSVSSVSSAGSSRGAVDEAPVAQRRGSVRSRRPKSASVRRRLDKRPVNPVVGGFQRRPASARRRAGEPRLPYGKAFSPRARPVDGRLRPRSALGRIDSEGHIISIVTSGAAPPRVAGATPTSAGIAGRRPSLFADHSQRRRQRHRRGRSDVGQFSATDALYHQAADSIMGQGTSMRLDSLEEEGRRGTRRGAANRRRSSNFTNASALFEIKRPSAVVSRTDNFLSSAFGAMAP